jgi:hypothetical protein
MLRDFFASQEGPRKYTKGEVLFARFSVDENRKPDPGRVSMRGSSLTVRRASLMRLGALPNGRANAPEIDDRLLPHYLRPKEACICRTDQRTWALDFQTRPIRVLGRFECEGL